MDNLESDRINTLNDVLPEQDSTAKVGKQKTAKMYFVQRDPATLSANNRPHGFSFIAGIPGITAYGKERLSRQLATVKKGRSAALTTPLLKEGESLKDYAQSVWSEFGDSFKQYSQLEDFERGFVEKYGPASVMYPYEQRRDQVLAYFSDPGGNATENEITVACDLIRKYVGLTGSGRLRPLSPENACKRLPAATQWALPFVVHGIERMTAEEEANYANQIGEPLDMVIAFWDHRAAYLDLAIKLMHDFNLPEWQTPCMTGWRGDMGKPTPEDPIGTKQRVVWMYPHAQSILESMYYPVLTEYLKGKPGFAAWLTEADTREKLFQFISSLQDEKGQKLAWSYDAIAFDQNLSHALIQGVSRNIVQPEFQEGTRALLDQLSQYSMTCGIVTPEGVVTGRNFNRPSGSGGTNLNDCLENMVGFTIAAMRVGYSEKDILTLFKEVMGDDAVYEVRADFNQEEIAKALRESVGAKVHADEKTDLTDQKCTFCKRLYTPELRGVASVCRVLLKAAVFERPTPKGWSQYMTELRWIDQLGMLSTHPSFTQAIDYVVARAPLKLGLSLAGGVQQLLAAANDIAWTEAAKTSEQLLDAEDRTLDAELGQARAPGRALVIEYLESLGKS